MREEIASGFADSQLNFIAIVQTANANMMCENSNKQSW